MITEILPLSYVADIVYIPALIVRECYHLPAAQAAIED